nr:AraC family transcriptional regulator [uncultured Allomuricauda sp.]
MSYPIQHIIDQIPIRHNIISSLMLMGVILGFFISFVIFVRVKKDSPIVLFAWSVLIQSIVCLDTYLCYTGLIKNILHFNDSTEPFVLLIPASLYFLIYGLLERKPISFKKQGWHFILPLAYTISQLGFYTSPISVKLNAYLGAYYDGLPKASTPENFHYNYMWIKDEFRWLILFSLLFYLLLSVRLILKHKGWVGSAAKNIRIDKYLFTKNTIFFFSFFLLFLYIIYSNYDDDGGDHYIVMAQTVTNLIILYFILSESRFFDNSWIADKYETLASETIKAEDIETFLNQDAYYLSSQLSLKALSSELRISTNALSKAINSEFGMNFNDYINKKRVKEAKLRLLDAQYAHLTIEAIGESVGFKSKSAFYNAFKKHTDTSPSYFIKQSTS